MVWAIVLLVLVALNSDGLSRVLAGAGTVIGVLAGVASLVQDRIENLKLSRVDPDIWRALVVLTLVADLSTTIGWPWWAHHQRTRTIDVTVRVGLSGNLGVLPGETAALDMDLPELRPRLGITFDVKDHNPDQGNCTPATTLRVTPAYNGNQGATVTAVPHTRVLVPIHAGAAHIHLEIQVVNDRQDKNCAVDLSVPSAVLRNG